MEAFGSEKNKNGGSMTKVSVITVCLNSEKTIEQTIKSVINQTYKNIEYIVIDGQSTDRTEEIIKKYSNSISKIVSEPDKGIYDAMNKGISYASGDIIGLLNSDDWYELDAVEHAVDAFETDDADVIYGKISLVYKNGYEVVLKNADIKVLDYRMCIQQTASFVRKAVYEKYGLYDQTYRIAADYELFLKIYRNGGKFQEIPYLLTHFRNSGVSNTLLVECAKETKDISMKYIDKAKRDEVEKKIEESYTERLKKAEVQRIENEILIYKNENLINKIKRIIGDQNICIFGTGLKGNGAYLCFRELGYNVRFWDNDIKKQGAYLDGIKIEAPQYKEKDEVYIIIAVMFYKEDIAKQLLESGYEKEKDFCFYDDFFLRLEV